MPQASARRILLTGATGFVGRHLLPALKAAFPEAAIVTNHFDVTDRAAVHEFVRDASPDACIHLAGITSVAAARSDPDLAWQVNLLGTLSLARAVLAFAPTCRFLFASSAEVYGASFRSGRPLDECAPVAPMNSYAAAKAAADLALGAMSHDGLRVISTPPVQPYRARSIGSVRRPRLRPPDRSHRIRPSAAPASGRRPQYVA